MRKSLFKISFLSICLVIAPFLRAGESPAIGFPVPNPSQIYIYGDYDGTIYLDGREVGNLQAHSKDPLIIFHVEAGPHQIVQNIPGDKIYCDIQSLPGRSLYVHVSFAGSIVGNSVEDLFRNSTSQSNLIGNIFVIGGGIFLLVGMVLLTGISVQKSKQP